MIEILKALSSNPRTTAAAVVAIAALVGAQTEAISEDKIAIIVLAIGVALSADGKGAGASKPNG